MTNKYETLRQKKQAFRQWIFSTTFRFTLITMLLVFGVLYLMQTSSLSTKGYEINDLEKQIQALEQENQKLGFEVATHRSMNSIQNRLAGLSMVEAGNNVEYVTLVGSAVAMR